MDENLSKNFNRNEFKCRGGAACCGGAAPVSTELINALQYIRDIVDSALTVTSGFRCIKHNELVGGVKNSRHTLGKAADLVPSDGDLAGLEKHAFESGLFKEIIRYPNFIHLAVE